MSSNSDIKLNAERIEVYTLGRFFVKIGDKLLSEEAGRSKKVWELFKYLIIHSEKSLLPEVVVENLWPENDYKDPNLVMRSLVYRLRRFLEEQLSAQVSAMVGFSQGCYQWNAGAECWVDIAEFEKLSQAAQQLSGDDPGRAIDTYQRAVSLYKGDFLPESSYSEWVLPLRSYYQRLFLQDVVNLSELLIAAHRYAEVIDTCEKAFMVEYFDEELHLIYLQTLLKDGKSRKARSHYEEVTSTFYREMGVKPSQALRELYRLINIGDDQVNLDLLSIQQGLFARREASGSFLCDHGVFRHLYQLECSRAERSGHEVYLGLFSFTLDEFNLPPQKLLEEAMIRLQDVLLSSLRKGDVVSRWNDAQYLIMLPGLNQEQAEKVMERLENTYKWKCVDEKLILNKKLQSVLPPEPFSAG